VAGVRRVVGRRLPLDVVTVVMRSVRLPTATDTDVLQVASVGRVIRTEGSA
jgi:hypothetical protein